jgi:GrpB-like predicted nucleotidyltransferase (UPF0157 family)
MPDLDEPVRLSAYNPEWPALFAAEADRIRSALRPRAAVEHIGSTSVTGLLAKPIIDIMLGVNPQDVDEVRQDLSSLGYEDMGEAGVPGRLYFRRRAEHDFNVHLVQRGGPIWETNMAFRQYLRHDAGAARAYAELKRSAVASGATMLLAYSEYKRPSMSQLVSAALASKAK